MIRKKQADIEYKSQWKKIGFLKLRLLKGNRRGKTVVMAL